MDESILRSNNPILNPSFGPDHQYLDHDLPRCLLHEEFQTGEVPAGCRVVCRYGSAVCLHPCCCPDRQQPLDDTLPTEAGCQVQRGGASSIPVLETHSKIRAFVGDVLFRVESVRFFDAFLSQGYQILMRAINYWSLLQKSDQFLQVQSHRTCKMLGSERQREI